MYRVTAAEKDRYAEAKIPRYTVRIVLSRV